MRSCLHNLRLLSVACIVEDFRQAHVVCFVRYITHAWQKVYEVVFSFQDSEWMPSPSSVGFQNEILLSKSAFKLANHKFSVVNGKKDVVYNMIYCDLFKEMPR